MNLDALENRVGQPQTTYPQDLIELVESMVEDAKKTKSAEGAAVWAKNIICQINSIQFVSRWPAPAEAWPDPQYLELLRNLHLIAYGFDAKRQYWASQYQRTKKVATVTKDPNIKKVLKVLVGLQLVAAQNGFELDPINWQSRSLAKRYRAGVRALTDLKAKVSQ